MTAFSSFDIAAVTSDGQIASREQSCGRHGPRPSKGCERCRKRKIKCDERHPVCSRCKDRGLECEYRDFSLLIFRDETTNAASKVRLRVRAKQIERRDAVALTLGPPKHILPSVQQTAVTRFFHDFVLERLSNSSESKRNAGFFALIPDMYSRSSPDSCFALALSAAANANFWRRHKSSQALANSLKDCGQALQRLQKELQRSSNPKSTADMLAGSSLLAMYEVFVCRDVFQRTAWTAHVYGAAALLEREDRNNPEVRKLAGVVWTVVFQLLIDSLIMGKHPSLPLELCTLNGAPPASPATLVELMYRTADLCATLKDISPSSSADNTGRNAEIDSFLERCKSLDEEIAEWVLDHHESGEVTILENNEKNIPTPLRGLFASPGAPTIFQLCADLDETHRWQFSRSCRLTILRTMITAVNTALKMTTVNGALAYYQLVSSQIHARISELVDETLSTVFSTLTVRIQGKLNPASFADIPGFRGFQLLWPLHVTGTCLARMWQHFPNGSEKFTWVRTLFRCIRDDFGIQAANNFLQTNAALSTTELAIREITHIDEVL